MPKDLLHVETQVGEPIKAGETRLIPMAQSIRILPSFMSGGLIWNRPVTVVARTPDGEEHIIPIEDVTRRAQLTLLAIGLIGSFVIWLVFKPRKI